MKSIYLTALAGAAIAVSAPASAVTVLTFEGIADNTAVGNFYAPDYIFSDDTLALVDADSGGGGNFANEPSPNTIMFFLNANNAVLNVPAGFDTGFSFFYTSSTAATVTVYDGLDATGNVLGTIDLDAQHTRGCTGDPNGTFCNWTAIGVAFAGTAMSIDFGGTANQTGYDNITFGSDRPGGAVPEPTTWAMMIGGLALVGASMRRRKVAVSFA
ncbi:hypothetical protein FHS91_001794 [Sphingobium xanthum]|uniref:PEPxxWA-CTERM sorting domain-containing protein n=1 Tax=Sphingobium xanthum TaxID=1387165 RepID=UPI001C8CB78C|nr:PEPxxWA-CTERM sorting domain-containing protein [Sphingobium xanthum]